MARPADFNHKIMIWEYIGTMFFGIIAFAIGFAAGRIHEKRHGKQSA